MAKKIVFVQLTTVHSVCYHMLLQEAVDIVQRHLHRGYHDACQELIETAAARWQEEEGDYRDDVRTPVLYIVLYMHRCTALFTYIL